VLIGDKYRIESDKLNITLSVKKVMTGKKVASAKGKIIWDNIAYFSIETPSDTLRYIVDYIGDLELAETGYKDFETVVKRQDELHEELHEFIDTVIREVAPQLERAV
jgi:hypothetical protein